jgi:hypothetical protein
MYIVYGIRVYRIHTRMLLVGHILDATGGNIIYDTFTGVTFNPAHRKMSNRIRWSTAFFYLYNIHAFYASERWDGSICCVSRISIL